MMPVLFALYLPPGADHQPPRPSAMSNRRPTTRRRTRAARFYQNQRVSCPGSVLLPSWPIPLFLVSYLGHDRRLPPPRLFIGLRKSLSCTRDRARDNLKFSEVAAPASRQVSRSPPLLQQKHKRPQQPAPPRADRHPLPAPPIALFTASENSFFRSPFLANPPPPRPAPPPPFLHSILLQPARSRPLPESESWRILQHLRTSIYPAHARGREDVKFCQVRKPPPRPLDCCTLT